MKGFAIVFAVSLVGSASAQDDPLTTARDLYAAAAYDEALAELAHVGSGAPPAALRETQAYRAFCLIALGRAAEAETVAESLVRTNPMIAVDQYPDASPRIVAMFSAVRKRVLPQMIRDEYRAARAQAVAKAPDAQARLVRVREMLGESEKIGAWDDSLEDLRVLVDGFLELSRASAPAVSAAAVTSPVKDTSEPAAPAAAAPAPTTVTAATAGVLAPIVVSQPPPVFPPALLDLAKRLHRSGRIDVVINEQGRVEDVIVTQSVNAAYDRLMVDAARTWKYSPALKDGVPVKFVKTVAVDVKQ
jgi:TonB family protein